jgi:hypothetical protein
MATTVSDDTQPITFSVPGQSGPAPVSAAATRGAAGPAYAPGQVKASVRVGTQRDGGAPVQVTAVPGEDIVAVHIENGPVLYLHPATARDLMAGAGGSSQRGGPGGGPDDGTVPVQVQLQWPGADTGGTTRDLADIGHVVVSAFQVIGNLFKDPVVSFVASQVVQHVDGQVDTGVYALRPDKLDKLKDSGTKLLQVPPHADPMLVLLHGTFVETQSTFEKLWSGHPGGVNKLFTQYGGRVYALDHPTLGASPIANARTLVDALPAGARLHLVSHSRGGLVAEVLARVAGQKGVTDDDLAFFAGANYATQREDLAALGAAVQAKGVQVERVVRVACPARGTLLASKRLDAYVSVLKWTLELAGVPVLPTFVDFIGEVARRRADPSEIPGLEAMIPDTPLVNWLNAAPQEIPGDLRVVAGDLEHGNTLGSWIKALLADAYYWTDNDIVVHTRSMYGGAPRKQGATFLLDQGPGVTHFAYFANDRTADAVVNALVEPLPPAGFRPIGPLSWAGEDARGERGLLDEAQASAADPRKPAVFVLPGILGSNLRQGGSRIWLGPRLVGGFSRLAYQPGGADGVSDDGPVGAVYSDLTAYLDATHEVIPFGYDWRRPLEEEAARLAQRLTQALDARSSTGQPVRILAHSMGGLLARTVQLVAPDVWQRLLAHADARIVMLGTPNGGSWAPMQVLSGDDTFGNALAAIGSPLANHQARMQMAAMPGFLQLQAGLLDDSRGLAQAATWQKLADDDLKAEQQKNWWQRYAGEPVTATYAWGVPTQAVLDQAKALRVRLDAQLDGVLKDCAAKLLLVVGHAKTTPDGWEIGNDGFTYLEVQDGGDGRVPLELALLPGVQTWSLDCDHGSLPSAKNAFDAYLDLLQRGTTARLATLSAATRSAGTAPLVHLRSRPSRRPPSALPAGDERAVLGGGGLADAGGGLAGGSGGSSGSGEVRPLKVTVLNGNLTFVHQPLMLGHYRALELTGTEAAIDRHLGGAMAVALRTGLYPETAGAQRIFFNKQADTDNPWQLPRPQAAIVIGLGEEGTLTAAKLEASVNQGVKAWSQRAAEETPGRSDGIELAATLIGSGGIGISAGASARAIAQGVRRANQRLAGSGWPTVARLTLVELYLDRAAEAWHGLHVLATSAPLAYEIAPTIASGTGPLRRQPEGGYRGADYDLISTSTDSEGTISFALDTRRARTEVRAQRTQPLLVRKLVERAATASASDPKLGSTLFQLLVPLELKPFLSGNDRLVLQLDDGTAPIPWELLDTGAADGSEGDGVQPDWPWSIRTRLLRKLSTGDFRNAPRDANADAAVLVIGEPKIDDPRYPPLPGARSEAQAVYAQLTGSNGLSSSLVTPLIDAPEFDKVIVTLMSRPWRIVHIAGHGAPVQRDAVTGKVTSRGGVVLSQGVFLGPDEIAKLPEVPELVFVNCCHLGGHDAGQTLSIDQPPAFAAGVADELIKIGVRCVVAAGWAVDDRPAEVFAQAFYRTLLAGRPFVDAVTEARKAARSAAPGSKTWAAYQCYGDPGWVFRTATGDAQAPAANVGDEFAGIVSAPGLALTLENLAVGSLFASPRTPDEADALRQEAQRKLRGLEQRYAPLWGGMGAIAEAFGVAWNAAGDRSAAIAWFERAVKANDASASLRAHEHWGNLRVRSAWAQALAQPGDAAVQATARHDLGEGLGDLQALARLQPTIERQSLCGSGLKRLAQLEALAGDEAASTKALRAAFKAYATAEAMAAEAGDPQLFYPGVNRMAIELVLNLGDAGWAGFDAAATAQLLRSLQAKHDADPDFWSNAGFIEIDFYETVAAGTLAANADRLLRAWSDLHARVQVLSHWGSVADQVRFVLAALARQAGSADQAAAAKLQAQLDRYAG